MFRLGLLHVRWSPSLVFSTSLIWPSVNWWPIALPVVVTQWSCILAFWIGWYSSLRHDVTPHVVGPWKVSVANDASMNCGPCYCRILLCTAVSFLTSPYPLVYYWCVVQTCLSNILCKVFPCASSLVLHAGSVIGMLMCTCTVCICYIRQQNIARARYGPSG